MKYLMTGLTALFATVVFAVFMPKNLPLAVIVFMVAWIISQAQAIIRRTSATEALGAVTALCMDKIGTLTENRIGFSNALCSNVSDAVAECSAAGIRVLIVSYDEPATAKAIGKQAGLVSSIVTGDEVETMSNEQLIQCLKTISIFARVRPHQKLRIVQSLKASGEIVAMTGDSVDDVAAIKAAHIGIITADQDSPATRDAPAITIKDDFASIVKALCIGRRNSSRPNLGKLMLDPNRKAISKPAIISSLS